MVMLRPFALVVGFLTPTASGHGAIVTPRSRSSIDCIVNVRALCRCLSLPTSKA